MQLYGIILSILTVILYSIIDVASKFAIVNYQVNALILVMVMQLSGALVLLIIAGPGRLGIATFKSAHTWLHGSFQLICTVFFTIGLFYITTTEARILASANTFFAILISWLALGRRPYWFEFLGVFIIAIAIIDTIAEFDPKIIPVVVFVYLFTSLFSALRTLSAETHPTSAKTSNVKDRCRVTGVVMLVISLCMFMFLAISAYAKTIIPNEDLVILQLLPSFSGILHKPTIIAGVIIGSSAFASVMYCYFYAARLVKTEILTYMLSIMFITTFIFESIVGKLGGIEVSSISNSDVIAGLTITASAIFMIYMKHHKTK